MDRKWLAELWRYRELVYFLAWRDVKVRYKQASLGAAWAILQPLATMVIFTLFFGGQFNTGSVPYPLFSYAGLVLWTYLSGAVSQSGQSLVTNSNLITKVYFPRVALPASSAVSALLDLGIGLAFMVVLMIYYQQTPAWTIVLAPVFLIALMMLTVGISLLISAMNVQYRDVKHAMPFMLQIWMFASPVIYPMSNVPERLRLLMAFNPLAGIVEGFRFCIFAGHPYDPMLTSISLGVTLCVFMGGVLYFRRTERAFADVI